MFLLLIFLRVQIHSFVDDMWKEKKEIAKDVSVVTVRDDGGRDPTISTVTNLYATSDPMCESNDLHYDDPQLYAHQE